jgi:hypothetical protein
MIQKGDECKYYTTTYRYIPTPITVGAQRVQVIDLFNGARPHRCIMYVKSQLRYNEAHQLNPNLLAFPTINYFVIKINKAVIPPVICNSKEAYVSLQQILYRRYSEMPFKYDDYVTSYGLIVSDLTPNKDSYNQMLPNSTGGIVSLDMTFTTAAQQLICIGKFCNQLSIGYQTGAKQIRFLSILLNCVLFFKNIGIVTALSFTCTMPTGRQTCEGRKSNEKKKPSKVLPTPKDLVINRYGVAVHKQYTSTL